jgi:hypothetical protein
MVAGLIDRPMKVLLAIAALLAAIVVLELLYPARPTAAEPAANEVATTGLPEFGAVEFVAPRFADLGEMLERPLFFSDRKLPALPAAETAPQVALTPLQLRLEGVALTGESRVAVLRDTSNNQLLQLAEGMMHDGWTLDSVTAAGASFSRGQQTTVLALDPDAGNRR